MVTINFYHLTALPLSQALIQLLEKTRQADKKAVVRLPSKERIESISNWLWVSKSDSWLPHGFAPTQPDYQPIWLTTEQDNPIDAEFLFVAESASMEEIQHYERVFYLFDSHVPQELESARALWKSLKQQEQNLAYFKQDPQGRWRQQQ